MKNWFTIGQFSQRTGLSRKALRLYEEIGLLKSHTRGDNRYRYYATDQLNLALRIKEFKGLGFSLLEIKSLLQADHDIASAKMALAMKSRLSLILNQVQLLNEQKAQIQNILASLEKRSEPMKAQQRRALMSFYGQVSIVVTGHGGLEKTAQFIRQHFLNANRDVPVYFWQDGTPLPTERPHILIINENDLCHEDIEKIHPDIVVIKGLGAHSAETESNYLKLYSDVGPHMNTIVNADDRAAVALAGQPLLKKGRIFYFSKNRALQTQLQNIGGVIGDGEDVEIYGFNLQPGTVHLKLKKIMPIEDETALLSSLAAVMTVGLDTNHLQR